MGAFGDHPAVGYVLLALAAVGLIVAVVLIMRGGRPEDQDQEPPVEEEITHELNLGKGLFKWTRKRIRRGGKVKGED